MVEKSNPRLFQHLRRFRSQTSFWQIYGTVKRRSSVGKCGEGWLGAWCASSQRGLGGWQAHTPTWHLFENKLDEEEVDFRGNGASLCLPSMWWEGFSLLWHLQPSEPIMSYFKIGLHVWHNMLYFPVGFRLCSHFFEMQWATGEDADYWPGSSNRWA